MNLRSALAVAALIVATSCVAPIERVQPRALAKAVPARPQPARPAIVPAGPSPMLLQPALVADTAPAATVAPPFLAALNSDAGGRALDCLTAAVYYEARSEPLEGQEAVAQVVLNRVRNPAFPNSVCGTVYEGSSRETGCQFTFTCDGSMAARRQPAAWERARRIAAAALGGFVYAPVGAATFYHTKAILPWWAPSLTRVAAIGAHIFYRLPGAWSGTLAFRQDYAGVEPIAAPGVRYPEKAAQQVVEAIEAGVRIHRGAAATGLTVERFGIRIHRGGGSENDDSTPAASENGVTVHVGPPPGLLADA